jgi:hypothetical protein
MDEASEHDETQRTPDDGSPAPGNGTEPTALGTPAGDVAAWGIPGHADPVLLAGRPRSIYVYVGALIAAAVADIAAFYQVLELVMADSNEYQIFALVIGFTGVVLSLAHFTGVTLRDRLAGARSLRGYLTPICFLVWLALGALAFYVRLRIPASDSGGSGGLSVASPGSSPSPPTGVDAQGTLPGAAFFAGLYAGTGMIAILGGFLTHNPLRATFVRALRAFRSASEAHAVASRRLALAEGVRDYRGDELESAARIREEALRERLALAEELKQTARLEISRRLQDASATDTFVKPDARPYTYRSFSN